MRLKGALLLLLLAGLEGCASPPRSDLRSEDPQTRCDAFNELFSGVIERGDTPAARVLFGRTPEEIHDLLGDPTSVSKLDHEGVHWLKVSYRFEVYPSTGGQEAFEQGWRYAPAVHFRDGVSVRPQRMWEDLGLRKYSMAPDHLLFKEGGTFP